MYGQRVPPVRTETIKISERKLGCAYADRKSGEVFASVTSLTFDALEPA